MGESLKGLTGTVGVQAPAGTVTHGVIITISKGRADEFMTVDQCNSRKTPVATPFIDIEVGIEEYGIIHHSTFPDYSGRDGKQVISPNTKHGRVLSTYPDLKPNGIVNMIAKGKDTPNGTIIIWNLVLA